MNKSRKEIHTEKLEGVKNSFKDLDAEIKTNSEGTFDENARNAMNAGNDAIKATASLTHQMLDSFDTYLEGVAAAFKNTDAKLAEAIGDPTPETLKDVKNSQAYKNLMARDTNNISADKTSVGDFQQMAAASK